MMNRKLCTTIPVISDHLKPAEHDYTIFLRKEEEMRKKKKVNFYKHHRAKDKEPLQPGQNVWITDYKRNGTVVEQRDNRL